MFGEGLTTQGSLQRDAENHRRSVFIPEIHLSARLFHSFFYVCYTVAEWPHTFPVDPFSIIMYPDN